MLRLITRLVLLLVLGVLASGVVSARIQDRVWPPSASAEKLASWGCDPETAVLRQAAAMQAAETQQAASSLGYETVSVLSLAAENAVTLEANAIRFSQSNVRSSLPELTQSMKANGWQGAPIDVVRMADGGLTAVDNTRLAAASLSNTPVRAVIRNFDEVFPAARAGGNLQGGTWGEAIMNRIGGQKPAWQQVYPNGSPFTGVHPSTPGFTP